MLFVIGDPAGDKMFWEQLASGLTAKGDLKGLVLDKDIQLKSTVCILLAPSSQNFVCWQSGSVLDINMKEQTNPE